MASFKLYLDTRSPRKDGTCPLKIAVHHKGRFLISLKVYVLPEYFVGNRVIIPGNERRQKQIEKYVDGRLVYVENALNRLMLLGQLQSLSNSQLKKILDTNSPIKEDAPPLFKEHFDKFVERKTNQRVKELFYATEKKMSKICDIDSLQFSEINVAWLKDFDSQLAATCKINTRAIHMRNIRAVFNDAIDEEVIDQNTYPFRKFKIKKESTRKRSLSIEELRLLRDYQCLPHQEQYRDIFMLIFYLCGINMVDLASLTEIRDGRIEYRRSKTGKLYSIKIEPEAMAIIEKYKGETYLLNILDNYHNYRDYLHRMNDNLKKIGTVEYVQNATKPKGKRVKTGPLKIKYNGLFPDLSTYWARHTWASIASELDIPKETISAALGHEIGSTITSIYIDFNQKKVDEANRRVIDVIKQDEAIK